jgi:hypothetical protein
MPPSDPTPSWTRPQFGFRALAMFSAIVAIVAALYGGLVRRGNAWPIYIALSCGAPVLLLIIVGALEWIVQTVAPNQEPPQEPPQNQPE